MLGRGGDVNVMWVGYSQDGQGETLKWVFLHVWSSEMQIQEANGQRPRSKDVTV